LCVALALGQSDKYDNFILHAADITQEFPSFRPRECIDGPLDDILKLCRASILTIRFTA
jgi:hypothetical protein